MSHNRVSRREILIGGALSGAALASRRSADAENEKKPLAQIAITLDLEMSRNFPTWETTHWDYEKGNLNEDTKRYAVEAARRVKAAGGVLHFFAVGRVFEQENIQWAEELVREGHPIGNHTYDHVNVLAQKPEDLQYRFRRAPWLIRGKTTHQVIRENIHLCDLALQKRLGKKSDGFRTPGGFNNGLRDAPMIRELLKNAGFRWVSSVYPRHPYSKPNAEPSERIFDGIVEAQKSAQPFRYPDGLVEIPMSPISDIGAFRTCRWQLDSFLEATRRSVSWAIQNRAVFDFLAHPSCLYVTDPQFKTIDLICKLVSEARNQAEIVSLDSIAKNMTQP